MEETFWVTVILMIFFLIEGGKVVEHLSVLMNEA